VARKKKILKAPKPTLNLYLPLSIAPINNTTHRFYSTRLCADEQRAKKVTRKEKRSPPKEIKYLAHIKK
jgi:hypothetical protein